jgi:hypothetical protein
MVRVGSLDTLALALAGIKGMIKDGGGLSAEGDSFWQKG